SLSSKTRKARAQARAFFIGKLLPVHGRWPEGPAGQGRPIMGGSDNRFVRNWGMTSEEASGGQHAWISQGRRGPSRQKGHSPGLRQDWVFTGARGEQKYGPQLNFAKLTNFNPHTNRYFGFTYSFAPDPGDYRKSLFQQVGMPDGPTTWDEMLTAVTQIKSKTKGAVRGGIGFSPEPDSNMAARALIWSFGGAEQDKDSNVTINSDAVVGAVDYMARLFKQAETAEVFSWNAASNNQGLVAGSLSFILNSISAYRTAQASKPDVA